MCVVKRYTDLDADFTCNLRLHTQHISLLLRGALNKLLVRGLIIVILKFLNTFCHFHTLQIKYFTAAYSLFHLKWVKFSTVWQYILLKLLFINIPPRTCFHEFKSKSCYTSYVDFSKSKLKIHYYYYYYYSPLELCVRRM